jgi:hypothetical protein
VRGFVVKKERYAVEEFDGKEILFVVPIVSDKSLPTYSAPFFLLLLFSCEKRERERERINFLMNKIMLGNRQIIALCAEIFFFFHKDRNQINDATAIAKKKLFPLKKSKEIDVCGYVDVIIKNEENITHFFIIFILLYRTHIRHKRRINIR